MNSLTLNSTWARSAQACGSFGCVAPSASQKRQRGLLFGIVRRRGRTPSDTSRGPARRPIGPASPSTRVAHSRACSTTNGLFIIVSAWAGTFDTLRRPIVVNGIG